MTSLWAQGQGPDTTWLWRPVVVDGPLVGTWSAALMSEWLLQPDDQTLQHAFRCGDEVAATSATTNMFKSHCGHGRSELLSGSDIRSPAINSGRFRSCCYQRRWAVPARPEEIREMWAPCGATREARAGSDLDPTRDVRRYRRATNVPPSGRSAS